ncbi:TPA: ROK family protein [Clostridium botulinum]|uniref:ROK family protein n=1 Tax=Clostridium botulinum TaxID=1491 RepID=UPI0015E6848F|nr:ROK family protein [Clostridium botulinum]HDK7164170.1 ROK family protein [Clostridium botulinum]HDK7166174.1 ROK family protein [Clostridium botulinum]HDK7171643.1 ROK family protein [Clostridium botulinum]HDK7182816.1 ROK family protein [Clostridium botulinum]HDK7184668.1 ROK family protein [Clostridium botulinum]
MKDSSYVRKHNINIIRRILCSGELYTKHNISEITGLSVATCNTILNELERNDEIIGSKQRFQEVGRSTVVYQLNKEHEYILCLYFEYVQKQKLMTYRVLSLCGNVVEMKKETLNIIDDSIILDRVNQIVNRYTQITQILIGTPSIAENGVIRHCDIPELENAHIVEHLEQAFHIPTYMENDMHFKAYGYYKKECTGQDIITLANFPSGVLPGTATVVHGEVIKGTNQFAGMVGFLDYGMTREQQIRYLQSDTFIPFAVKSVCSIIAILNPKKILFTGDLFNNKEVQKVQKESRQVLPEEYMPELIYIENIEPYYFEGMYQKALDLKEELER